MVAMSIIAMIFAMFATALLIAIYVLRLTRKFHRNEAIALAALGVLFLGHLFLMIGLAAGSAGLIITGLIFYLLGWPGLAIAFLLMHLDLFSGLAAKVQASQPQQPTPGQQVGDSQN
jgi:hypothetical protein